MTSFIRLSILSTTFLLCIVCASAAEVRNATVRYVNADAEGAEDGTSWEDAWTDLQTALGEAGDDVEIRVARGTYTPGTRRGDTLRLVNGVIIRGGFAGTEDVSFDLARRDFAANETTLSGEIGSIGLADNVYHVITSNDTDETAVLDGFTIAAGRASGLTDLDQDKGGGLLNIGGSPTIKNCIFRENESGSWGGAVHNACGSPTLINCIFVHNSTTVSQGENNKGGGMYSTCDQAIVTSPTLINCLFIGNTAGIGTGGNGGGYYDDAQSSSLLVNCTFVANHADSNGGGICGNPTLANCILWNNSDRGGTDSSAQIFGSAIVTFSCVHGGWPGTGNISDDPLFVSLPARAGDPDPILGDLRLSSISPCIDAGNNEMAVRDVALDLAGSPRFVDDPGTPDTGSPPGVGAMVDMGAYEFLPPCEEDAECDNDDPCTDDYCDDAIRRCVHEPLPCSDGVFCNGIERCVDGTCEPGTPPECDDGLPCTLDSCNESAGACDHIPDHTLCDNELYCDGVETCDASSGCAAGDPVDCGDSVVCTVDLCDENTDSCEHLPEDALCDDTLFCNGSETCDAVSGCLPGIAPECDDDIPCTEDSCRDVAGACAHVPVHEACDNAIFCDGLEVCDPANGCQSGVAVDCDDEVACTIDSCNEVSGSCENVPDNAVCDDGLFCNGLETCDPLTGCQPGTPPCQAEFCDDVEDTCFECADDTHCDDGVDCTNNTCIGGGCAIAADDTRCADDGLFCNGPEVCDTTLGCVSTGDPCDAEHPCNESMQRCDECQLDAGCNDGDPCTRDRCADGSCTNSPISGCGDGGGTTPDPIDACPNDPDKTEPGVCGCGVPDEDLNADGVTDCLDACPEDPDKIAPGICGCGLADTDSDEDGTPDCIDNCPNDPNKTAVGLCGCGLSDADSDGDRTPDCIDNCPNDPNKTAVGLCGCGLSDEDADNDGVLDCIDACLGTESDVDVTEDGCPIEPDPSQSMDDDGDGVPDESDLCADTPAGTEVDDDGCAIDDVAPQPTPEVDDRRSCGACGAFDTLSASLLLIGWLSFRSGSRRTPHA